VNGTDDNNVNVTWYDKEKKKAKTTFETDWSPQFLKKTSVEKEAN
jgi:hypothetical protein